MRKLCIILLLVLCFPLFAQQTPESAIYIPYVEGSGSGVEDNSYFLHLLETETLARNYRAVQNREEANYSLIGRINPHGNGDFIFQLELVNNNDDSIIVRQDVIYHYYTEAYSLFSILMLTMFSNIPERPREDPMLFFIQRPQDHWLILGAYGFWTPRIYSDNDTSVCFLNFGAGLSAEWYFLNFLSFETGVEFTSDWLLIAGKSNDEYHDFILETPIFLKYVYNPSGTFFIGPLAGIKTTVSLRKITRPSAVSWLAGLQYGVRIGPGFVFVEARYSADTGNSRVNAGFSDQKYRRHMLNIGVGYKYGFFPKERK